MKGVKCFLSQKFYTIFLVLFVLLFTLLSTVDVFALDGDTGRLYYRIYSVGQDSVQWSSDLDVGEYDDADHVLINTGGGVRLVRAFLPATTWTGNQLVTHWEINVVCGMQVYGDCTWFPQGQATSMSVQNLRVNNNTTSIQSATWSYAVTPWTRPSGTFRYMSTLTLYLDIIADAGSARSGVLDVIFGNPDLLFLLNDNSTGGSQTVYIEKIVASVNSTDSTSNSLQQTQINQNNTIINQNQQIIDQDNQDRSELQNTSDDGQSDAASAAADINNAKTSLLTVIGNFINIVIHPPASNCVIDADMGNMDLGDIDLCQLSLPPAFAVIGSLLIIGFIIPFAYSLIMTILSLLKGATDN